jgi:two-component system response regulator VanR
MVERILIVDDEREITDLVALYLENEGYSVCKCYDGILAQKLIDTETFDLAILDVMLPDVNGFALCSCIREKHNFPIIMLTAKVEATDKISGLSLGADDYITKPFLPLELIARVKAQLRRYKRYNTNARSDDEILIAGGLVLNLLSHDCTLNERPLLLTPTEFSILRILCQNKGKVVSAEELFRGIWGEEYYSKNNNTITVHILNLRRKLEENPSSPRLIRTVWGKGYQVD